MARIESVKRPFQRGLAEMIH